MFIPLPRPLFVTLAIFFVCVMKLGAATYHVDPRSGSMSNPGTSNQPWSTLEAVFLAKKTFAAGDVILLRNGFHGGPVIRGLNRGTVTIKPESGHQPKLRSLAFLDASRWTVTGLDLSPLHAGPKAYSNGRIVDIRTGSSHITVQDCRIRSVFSVAGWSLADWKAKRLGNAVYSRAPYTVITGNQIENIGTGIQLAAEAQHSVVSYNVIDTIRDDGFRGLASNCKFEYNTLRNMYAIDGNHDDAFQSWSLGPNGGVGSGVVSNVELRGNVFISYTDPKQPWKSSMQGIGLFDGMFDNWVIENNLIVTDMWHGIAVFGARNCRIVNNTVVSNPLAARKNTPWIEIRDHKKGMKASNNIVRNNLTTSVKFPHGAGTESHNLRTKDFAAQFVNFAKFDFRLKSSSAAVGAGTSSTAPGIDADKKSRSGRVDIGAYQLNGTAPAKPAPAPVAKPTETPAPQPAAPAPKPVVQQPKPAPAKPAPAKPVVVTKPTAEKAQTAKLEIESLARTLSGAGASVEKSSGASNGRLVQFRGNRANNWIQLTTPTLNKGKYRLKLRYNQGSDHGIHNVTVDGKTVASSVDHYGKTSGFKEVTIGQVTVTTTGPQKVRFTIRGKHKDAGRHWLALDRLTFEAM